MNICAWYWRGAALVTGVGVAMVVLDFEADDPRMLLGLTMIVIGALVANTGFIAQRARSLDEEFEAGHRIGYRAGRRAPRLEATTSTSVTPIRRVPLGLSAFNKAALHGGISEAPVRPVAGVDPSPGRSPAHTH